MSCLGFPPSIDCTDLFRLKHTLETTFQDVAINPITILSTALNSKEDALCLHSRLKLSAYERDMAFFLAEHKAIARNVDDLLYVTDTIWFFSRKFVSHFLNIPFNPFTHHQQFLSENVFATTESFIQAAKGFRT